MESGLVLIFFIVAFIGIILIAASIVFVCYVVCGLGGGLSLKQAIGEAVESMQ